MYIMVRSSRPFGNKNRCKQVVTFGWLSRFGISDITICLHFQLSTGKTKIYCAKCQKKCSGEVLRVTDKYFHKSCFQCVKCNKSLAIGGFFAKDNNYYCVVDYQKTFGTKCAVCQNYVEGEVVSTMGNTYHQKCFTCTSCSQPFESGSKVIKSTLDMHTQGMHSRILNERFSYHKRFFKR